MAHTPGPWIIRQTKNAKDRVVGYSIRRESEWGDPVAGITCGWLNGEELENARLIAAAPELLQACKAMLPWICKGIESGAFDACVLPNAAHIAVKQAESAIAKAEGK